MKNHEFFQKYANTPLRMRNVPIDYRKGSDLTLDYIFKEVQLLEDQIRPLILKRDEFIEIARPVLERF